MAGVKDVVKILNYLAGYGVSGNDNIGLYQRVSTFASNSNTSSIVLLVLQLHQYGIYNSKSGKS